MKILLVRLRQIGDVVFTTPALGAIRRHFHDAHIAYLVEPAAAPVVEGSPHIDELIVAPRQRGHAGVRAEIALIRRLRASAFDLAVDFHGGPRASLLTWASGARTRIGYTVAGRGWMYTTRVARPRELRARHSVENQWDLLTAMGISPPDPGRNPVEMPVDPRAAERVTARLNQAGIPGGAPLAILHVSAGNPFRRWPIEAFGDVAAGLLSAHPALRVIVTAGPSEADAARRVIAAAQGRLPATDRSRVLDGDELSLIELRALLDRVLLYIGGDSGPLHIAATSRAAIVGLYGPTLPARSAPWRSPDLVTESVDVPDLPCRPCEQRHCVPGDFRCLTRIAPSHVVDAATRALAAASR